MLQQIEQPFSEIEILNSITEVKVQIEDLVKHAKSKFAQASKEKLFMEAETLLRTEQSVMHLDDLIGHLENLINLRDAIAYNIQSYMQELNAKLEKISKSVNAYKYVGRSSESAPVFEKDVGVSEKLPTEDKTVNSNEEKVKSRTKKLT